MSALSVSSTPAKAQPALSYSTPKGKAPATAQEVSTPVAAASAAEPAAEQGQVVAIIQDDRDEEELAVVEEAKAEIYLFDAEVEHFVLQGQVKITLIEKDAKTFDCESLFDLLAQFMPSLMLTESFP